MEYFSQLISVILHFDAYLEMLVIQYGNIVYGILFLIVFLETGVVVMPFLPGDSLLFAVGAISAQGSLQLVPVMVCLLLAAILGDTVNYWVGRFAGERLMTRFPKLIKPAYLERTRSFFERYGPKTIVLCRFVPIVRTIAPFLAGAGYMHYSRFMRYNVAGAFLWVFLLVPAGYFFSSAPFVRDNFSLVILAIIVLSLLPMGIEFYREYKKKKSVPSNGL